MSALALTLAVAITTVKTNISAEATLALLLFVVIVVNASSFTTYQTTITSSVETDSQGGQQQCSQAHRQIVSCESYLRESAKLQGGMWREEFPRCCKQLEQQCRCQALKEMFEQQLEDLQYGRKMRAQTWTETLQTASSSPVMCRIPPEKYCEVGGATGSLPGFRD